MPVSEPFSMELVRPFNRLDMAAKMFPLCGREVVYAKS